MTSTSNTTMVNSALQKTHIKYLKMFNYTIINQAVIKCLNKSRKLQFIENLPHLLINILHRASQEY